MTDLSITVNLSHFLVVVQCFTIKMRPDATCAITGSELMLEA